MKKKTINKQHASVTRLEVGMDLEREQFHLQAYISRSQERIVNNNVTRLEVGMDLEREQFHLQAYI